VTEAGRDPSDSGLARTREKHGAERDACRVAWATT